MAKDDKDIINEGIKEFFDSIGQNCKDGGIKSAEKLKKDFDKWDLDAQGNQKAKPCPDCGRCPTCGRGGYQPHYYNEPPKYPWLQPHWRGWDITC